MSVLRRRRLQKRPLREEEIARGTNNDRGEQIAPREPGAEDERAKDDHARATNGRDHGLGDGLDVLQDAAYCEARKDLQDDDLQALRHEAFKELRTARHGRWVEGGKSDEHKRATERVENG